MRVSARAVSVTLNDYFSKQPKFEIDGHFGALQGVGIAAFFVDEECTLLRPIRLPVFFKFVFRSNAAVLNSVGFWQYSHGINSNENDSVGGKWP